MMLTYHERWSLAESGAARRASKGKRRARMAQRDAEVDIVSDFVSDTVSGIADGVHGMLNFVPPLAVELMAEWRYRSCIWYDDYVYVMEELNVA